VRRLLLVVAAALLWVAPAQAFTKQTGTRTMTDGVGIAYDLYEPDGAVPAGGWPGVIVMHGLGGSKDDMGAIAGAFVSHGYAVLAYTDRGHGTSGGVVGLAAGIPYKAAEVVETWTDLYSALFPQNLAKSGIVLGFAKAVEARSPLIAAAENDAIHSTNMGALKTLADSRSSYAKLPSISTPVYMFQGRVDYAFDVGQALNGYTRITGPKHLYVGQFGHTPSTFPGPDVSYVLSQGVAWYDRYLKNAPNGIDKAPPVTIAAATGSKRTSYTGLPKTKVIPAGFMGTATQRTGPKFGQALETFGVSLLKVQVRKVNNYPRLVATVLAGNRVITHGGIVPKVGLNTIRLADYVQYLPKGTRLTVTFGDSSTKDVAYLGFGSAGTISLGPAELSLQVLTKPISK
jgi:hypothetical protein